LNTSVIKKDNFVYTVNMTGSLDSGNYELFERELQGLIDEKTRAVVLDMKGLEYISSAGIRVVISTEKALKRQGASFAMINLQPQIKRVFEAMKILPIFNVFEDIREADRYLDEVIQEEIAKDKK